MANEFKIRVYTDRPAYADFDAPRKFMAIESIIAKRLKEHPNAICSYSGGSDSDIMLHLIERVRKIFDLPKVDYVFFNTGLEMEATKRHVREVSDVYGVDIRQIRPEKNIVRATREYGLPFMNKVMSDAMSGVQRKGIPLEIAREYDQAQDKCAKYAELRMRFPRCVQEISFLCGCRSTGEPAQQGQLSIWNLSYMLDFIQENPIPFRVSAKCCEVCKKRTAHREQRGYDMVITGERYCEGGARSLHNNGANACFYEMSDGKFRLRPLYYVSNADKAWYKAYYGIRYSEAYEVYGLKRTGCCGCPINAQAVDDLEKIRPYEPNLVKAAWNVFGESYLYRQKYNEYKYRRQLEEKQKNVAMEAANE